MSDPAVSWDPYADDLKDEAGVLSDRWLKENLERDPGFAVGADALEILVDLYLDPERWARCRPILRKHGLLRDVERALRRREKGILPPPAIRFDLDRVVDLYDDAPVGPEAEVPLRWRLTKPGDGPVLWMLTTGGQVPVAYSPLVISALAVGVADGRASVEIAWRCGGHWRRKMVKREAIKGGRDLVAALGGCEGFPCDANNAKLLISYLTDYEAHNEGRIGRRRTAGRMGWVEGGKLGFLAGAAHVGGDGPIDYLSPSRGAAQLTRHVRPSGSLAEWVATVATAADRPGAMFTLYAGLSTPLIEILGVPCFTVHWSGKTSLGKTTSLRMAASCWGDPADGALLTKWDQTGVGFERNAEALSGLPLFADETKRARDERGKSPVPRLVYQFADGVGRVRGSTDGMAETSSWKSILFSTGEGRIIDISKDGGVAGRVIDLTALPFVDKSQATADLVKALVPRLMTSHGHAGPAVAAWLCAQRDHWDELRAEHSAAWRRIRDRVAATSTADHVDQGVVDRLACSLAVVEIGARVAHWALPLPWELRDPIAVAIKSAGSGAGVADREREALRFAVAWAQRVRERFCRSESHRRTAEPPGGWVGFWQEKDGPSWDVLAFNPDSLRSYLEERGFEYKAIVRAWREAGWLRLDDPARSTSRVNDLDGRPRMVQVTREACELHGDYGGGGGEQGELPI